MILLWGAVEDSPFRAVRSALVRMKEPTFVLDQSAVLASAMELQIDRGVSGRLRVTDEEVDLEALVGAYLRTYDWTRLPLLAGHGPETRQWTHAQRFHHTMWTWADITPVNVVNRPSSMASNSSKPYQSREILSAGFRVPETLVTTSCDAVMAFWERHGTVVYKSISSVRSVVSRLTSAHADRLQDIAVCPTQFQEYVPGVDYRVHVVGDDLFCSRITTRADDYRYASREGFDIDVSVCEVPESCAQTCSVVCSALNLPVAGIDLRRTPDWEWYCFEVNPSPAFTFYDRAPGEPIAQAIASFVAGTGGGQGAR